MAWRDTFLLQFGPGFLGGITLGRWLRLLWENRFAIPPTHWLRAAAITAQCGTNSLFACIEEWRYGAKIAAVEPPPPLFLLGHWRNGTTHLHNLLTIDERFAFPNNYQTMYPFTFLTTEAFNARIINWFLPRHRPLDNIEWTMASPQEDEFALLLGSFRSPYLSWAFPWRRDVYDPYLTFRDVPPREIAEWQAALLWFVKKLAYKFGKPVVLKSPPHTCRIKQILEVFPQAKFVHIRRDPYAVFPSTRKTIKVCCQMNGLQPARTDDLDDRVLRHYREMYEAFFDQRDLIPAGNFCEVGFEELERDPVGEVRRIYESLNLPDFSQAEPALTRYAASLAGYKKNAFPELPAELRSRIANEWERCFTEWGYRV